MISICAVEVANDHSDLLVEHYKRNTAHLTTAIAAQSHHTIDVDRKVKRISYNKHNKLCSYTTNDNYLCCDNIHINSSNCSKSTEISNTTAIMVTSTIATAVLDNDTIVNNITNGQNHNINNCCNSNNNSGRGASSTNSSGRSTSSTNSSGRGTSSNSSSGSNSNNRLSNFCCGGDDDIVVLVDNDDVRNPEATGHHNQLSASLPDVHIVNNSEL